MSRLSEWAIASFLSSSQPLLGSETPRDWLLKGGAPHQVAEAALRVAGHLAH